MGKICIETPGYPVEFEIDVATSVQDDSSTPKEIQAVAALAAKGATALPKIIKTLKNHEKAGCLLAALHVLAAWHKAEIDVSSAFPALVACIQDGEPKVVAAAQACFSCLGKPALQWLIKRIEQQPDKVPDDLCEFLAQQADQREVLEFINAGAKSTNGDRRHVTASIVDEIFTKQPELARQPMVELMYRLQADEVQWVRTTASMGLSRAPQAVEVDFGRVVRNLCWEDDPFMAHFTELTFIGGQRDRARDAIPALLELRESPPPGPYPSPREVRANVTNALCMIDPDKLCDYLRELVEIEAAVTSGNILATLDENVATALLREWLADPRPTVVATAMAAAALDGFVGSNMATQIAGYLKDKNKDVQQEAAKALRDISKLFKQFKANAGPEEKQAFAARYNDGVAAMKDCLKEMHKVRPTLKGPAAKVLDAAIKNIEALSGY